MRNELRGGLRNVWRALASVLIGIALCSSVLAADIQIINASPPGIGLNDPTPAAPVGGNDGTTVGAQSLKVFERVAEIWGKKLRSDIPVSVLTFYEPLECDATSAVLGAAGAMTIWRDFPNAPRANTWYPSALANKLARTDLLAEPQADGSEADIVAFFNSALGAEDCLAGSAFYLGLDGQAPAGQIDLLTTVLHEVGHGLGFQTFTDDATGAQIDNSPSVWDHLLLDPQRRKTWATMNDAERAASAITPRNLVWNGSNVHAAAPRVLDRGTPDLFVAGRDLNRFLLVGPAAFGPPLSHRDVAAELVQLVDQPDGRGLACTPLTPANAALVKQKVALIDRGGCAFTVKVKNAQTAGARAVLIADNAPGSPPFALAGADPTITIPSLRITLDDGVALKTALAPNRPHIGPVAVLFDNVLKLAGADYFGRVYMYTPKPNSPGSSVSHYDFAASPNLLMEPFAEPNQAIAVSAPKDLTLELLKDIGW
jgi:hypothetical protein